MSGIVAGEMEKESYAATTKSYACILTIITIFVGCVIGLLAAEYTIRIFAPQALLSDIIAPDPDVDYRLRPGAAGHMSSLEYSAEIYVNSLGFRGPEISSIKPAGVTRVLFLGDSFVFGHGLAERETLPFLVGQELERTAPGKFEVINGGVYGYSTADELHFFEKFGMPLKPDIVVTLLLFPNDVADNATVYKMANDRSLIRQRLTSYYSNSRNITRFIPGADWLRARSHLFKFLGVRLLPVIRSGVFGNTQDLGRLNIGSPSFGAPALSQVEDAPFSKPEFFTTVGGPFNITAALLSKLATRIKECHANPILLTLGEKDEYDDGRLKQRAVVFQQELSRTGTAAGFPAVVGLSQILEQYSGNEKLYFPQDGHWTAAATRFVAPEVARTILGRFGKRSE